ncbi:hypothetical protein CP985_04405 [Malaciobacter mytili LMG 24559]|uniref:PepSY domain-containing membrane protein n=1 Tax=Malaciobacter mytili LMG 24559 TaxID=1032238 RepID=A0AAX2AIS9_9BACT|nr:hypothetical protein [Malaciobacter mytili]AXH14675.1 putative membrane protein [Malaciobacter mytili LMG 24559]RXK16227.1 hypothetical protein CP985_04405 [Malaciobacter mytili LMG 24559]
MKKKSNFSQKIRALHRDLGYFTIGLTLVYALSGIVLSGRALGWLEQKYILNTKIEKYLEEKELKNKINEAFNKQFLEKNIPNSLVQTALDFKHLRKVKENQELSIYKTKGKVILYEKEKGNITYEFYSYPIYIKKFIIAHKATHEKAWFYLAILYSIILIYLSISAIFMIKGKYGFKRRGVYFMLGGIATIVLFISLG